MFRKMWKTLNWSLPAQNGCHFADNIFICIFMKENLFYFDTNLTEICSQLSNWQLIIIGSGNDLVLSSNKPLPETMMAQFTDAYRRHEGKMH